MVSLISESRKVLLLALFKDEAIRREFLLDNEKIAPTITIQDDGSVLIQRSRNWFINWLFGGNGQTITFMEVAFRIANVMSGHGSNKNDKIFKGISEEIIEKAIQGKDYDYVVDALFATNMFGFKGGYYASKYIKTEDKEAVQKRSSTIRTRAAGMAAIDLGGGAIPIQIYVDELPQ